MPTLCVALASEALNHTHTPNTGKDLREAGVGWRDVFVEVPIKLHNSSLAQALIADANPGAGATAADLERLSMANTPYLCKTMTGLIEVLDDIVAEQGKVRGCVEWAWDGLLRRAQGQRDPKGWCRNAHAVPGTLLTSHH
jgi:hypothetical protein